MNPGCEPQTIQMWNHNDIIKFYKQHINSIWIGHNNTDYDNHILEAIVKNKDVWLTSCDIINNHTRHRLSIHLYYYDLMQLHRGSLKVMEAAVGKNISESGVDFNIDRPLTEQERLLTESYNRDDLEQTLLDLQLCKSEFQLRIDLIKEFNLPLDALHYTQAQIAEHALHVARNDDLINQPILPTVYNSMHINNERILRFYLNQDFRRGIKPQFSVCNLLHQMGAGGMHAAQECYHTDWAYYFDVSGYYNLIMINYNLLSRAIPEQGKKLYEYMYHQQLKLKVSNPRKRAIYKVILLAVSGAQRSEESKFYDTWCGELVPVVGQMFLVDLLEKLEGKVVLIQSNTDGIIAKPTVPENVVLDTVKEWCDRTGLTIIPKKIYDIHQRDVNNYMYRDDKHAIHCVGGAVKYYEKWENPLEFNSFNCTEPFIIQYGIVDYYMNGVDPKDTVEKYKSNLRMFQWICKPGTYDYLTFEDGQSVTELQKINRCFASNKFGMIYKNKPGKHDRYSSLADNIFIYNDEILSDNTVSKLMQQINYDYYVRRIWQKIEEFKKQHEQLSLLEE